MKKLKFCEYLNPIMKYKTVLGTSFPTVTKYLCNAPKNIDCNKICVWVED